MSAATIASDAMRASSRGQHEDEAIVRARAETLFEEHRVAIARRTDRFFATLMIGQWLAAIAIAVVYSPYAWEGRVRTLHVHVWAAVVLGGAISSLPVALAWLRPGAPATRLVIAGAQMLWSALLIHLTGGRIETHFHVFGSLAFLAFYRDWRVIVPATIVVAADHFARGVFWPESVYGISSVDYWRFLEHTFWVAFEDAFLVLGCISWSREMREMAYGRAELELVRDRERDKSHALDEALTKLRDQQETLVRTEKLAAVGQLAASVGHELRNPLFAIRNANAYLAKKLPESARDDKVERFLALIDREIGACTKIISDLLDFARERPPSAQPCPLRPLVEEAISLVPPGNAVVVNAVPEELPVPALDKEQFRQVLVNLVQNAVESMSDGRTGEVVVRAEGGGNEAWRIVVTDDGPGIAPDVAKKIFEPLFTTKTKGTGLGLAIVSNMVKAHRGRIEVDSEPGRGTHFRIDLPPAAPLEPAG
jgi:signal transduction histidine kinase